MQSRHQLSSHEINSTIDEISSKFTKTQSSATAAVRAVLMSERDEVVFSQDTQMACLGLATAARSVVYSSMHGVTPELTEQIMRKIFCNDHESKCPSKGGLMGLLEQSCAEVTPISPDQRDMDARIIRNFENFIKREGTPLRVTIAFMDKSLQSSYFRLYKYMFRVKLCIAKLEACAGILDDIITDPYNHGISLTMMKHPALKAKLSLVDPAVAHLKSGIARIVLTPSENKIQALADEATNLASDVHQVVRNLLIIQLGVRSLMPAIRLHVALSGFLGVVDLDIPDVGVLDPKWSKTESCTVPDYRVVNGETLLSPEFRIDKSLFLSKQSSDVWRFFSTAAKTIKRAIQQQIKVCGGAEDAAETTERRIMVVPRSLMREYLEHIQRAKKNRNKTLFAAPS